MNRKVTGWGRALLCLALAAMMSLVGLGALAAPGEEGTVSVRIEGVTKTLAYEQVPYAGESVLEVVRALLNARDIPYTEAGGYISAIGQDAAGAFGGWDGWVYYINEQSPVVGMAEARLEAGDRLLVCYADSFGTPPTLLPQVTVDATIRDFMATFTFTAQITTYDAAGAPTGQTVPVANAAVTLDGVAHTTNAQGVIKVDRRTLKGETASLQIDKKAADGRPLVIRFAPDYKVTLPFNQLRFTDISPNAWYREYVLELTGLGAIDGYDDGTFRPTREVTRAEFVKLLVGTVSGFDPKTVAYQPYFTDVKAGSWYAPYIVWAVGQGMIDKGGSFNPDINLTRQDMALIAYRFATGVLKKTLPTDAPAPAFNDDADIADRCREAVYLLQKAGVILGVPGNRFVPGGNSLRSDVSKVVVKLINLP